MNLEIEPSFGSKIIFLGTCRFSLFEKGKLLKVFEHF